MLDVGLMLTHVGLMLTHVGLMWTHVELGDPEACFQLRAESFLQSPLQRATAR